MGEIRGLKHRIAALFERLESLQLVPIMLARVSVGIMFAGGAVDKLRKLPELVEYFKALGIPAASAQAPFVAAVELVGGTCLILGLATRVFSLMLTGTMVVAILTATFGLLQPGQSEFVAAHKGLTHFFYLPEWLLIVVRLWLAFSGPGPLSIDSLLKKKLLGTAEGK